MFLGTHHLRLDDKGRLALPAKWNSLLSEGLVVTKGQEDCLYVFSQRDFADLATRLRTTPLTGQKLRDYSRVFFSSASAEMPDKQRRVTLPALLRSYASLEKDCTVVGVNNHAEIWDSATWEAWLPSKERSFSEVVEEVVPGAL